MKDKKFNQVFKIMKQLKPIMRNRALASQGKSYRHALSHQWVRFLINTQ